jgi:hypothetical protein
MNNITTIGSKRLSMALEFDKGIIPTDEDIMEYILNKEDLVIEKWLEKEFPLRVNLDKEAEELSSIKPEEIKNKEFKIWGANVHFINEVPREIGIGVALTSDGSLHVNNSENITNSIIIFNME